MSEADGPAADAPDRARHRTGAKTRRRARKIIASTAAAVLLLPVVAVGAFLLIVSPPVEPFEPRTWSPERADHVEGIDIGASVSDLSAETLAGPEDIAVDRTGMVYTGTIDGLIVRIDPATGASEEYADVGGRPLGLAFDAAGDLIVANHGLGLQSVSPCGEVRLLTGTAGGEPVLAANDLDIASDGVVYFTDSNRKYNSTTLGERTSYSLYDFLEGRPLGRLLSYDPATEDTEVVSDDLYFPNGVVLDAEETAVLVGESTRFRISRHWIAGPEAGSSDVLADDLPGISDGFGRDERGGLILSVYGRIDVLEDFVLPSRLAREIAVRLPEDVLLGEPLTGSVLSLSEDGVITERYSGLDPAATNVVPHEGEWIIGSLVGEPVRVLPSPLGTGG
ncbi:SMP-30/gluconolactonase/LRE family protein [Glycomyces salinus]|uniref:SMP-30/gluconolactonase/LRE family protein n=1 Tax=Glycomyces salinus TaxID=980294 RepID=UPI0018EAC5D6|nr:SMP-30/gluconolactonase/LRE family protein [Glycomyces salinus]